MKNKTIDFTNKDILNNEIIAKENSSKIFFAKFNKSCLITYVGIVFSVLAMCFAFTKSFLKYSLSCLIISGICDMYDGKFARACKRTEEEKEFGIQLDSLADVMCFIATPIVIMLSINMTQWYCIVAYSLFAICGISRLGYFNIKADLDKAVKTYKGLPVTSTAIIYPLIGLLHVIIPTEVLAILYLIATIITAILFVVNIKVPKFKGVAYIIVPIIAMIAIFFLLVK